MNNEIESKEYKGYIISVVYDEYPECPREWDNLGTIYSNRKGYRDDNRYIDEFDDGNGRLDEKYLDKNYVWLPIYCYEHGGIALSTRCCGCFSDPWDSGLFGIIAVSKEDIRENYGCKIVTKKIRERVEKCLKGEVEELNRFYNGDVYGYVINDKDGNLVDSCYGYYCDDYGELFSEAEGIIGGMVD